MDTIKKCGCCGRTYTGAEWATLKALGTQLIEDDDGSTYGLEMVNCTCGSTIAIEHRPAVSQ